MKFSTHILFLITIPSLFCNGCVRQKDEADGNVEDNLSMKLFIDNQEVEVNWLDNDSVNELKNVCPLEINMSRYGGFEQVGSIGQKIISHDSQTTTSPGDIVLYNSNNIVIFYGSNSWSYTRLGHIDLNKENLIKLLDKPSVILNLK